MKIEEKIEKNIEELQTEFECPACLSGRLIKYAWLDKNWYRCNAQNCDFEYPEHCLLFHYPDSLS